MVNIISISNTKNTFESAEFLYKVLATSNDHVSVKQSSSTLIIEPVDLVIDELIISKKFNKYIDKLTQELYDNPENFITITSENEYLADNHK